MRKLLEKTQIPNFFEVDQPHSLLADLNLPVYITTNYDDFLERALESRMKKPLRDFAVWNKYLKDLKETEGKSSLKDSEPTNENPLVYHLCGQTGIPQSMVMTEEDYKNFLFGLSEERFESMTLPTEVQIAIRANALLFIGYSIGDWKLDILINWIERFLGNISSLGVIVHPRPKGIHFEQQFQYVQKYFKHMRLIVYWGTVKSFCRELRQRLEKMDLDENKRESR